MAQLISHAGVAPAARASEPRAGGEAVRIAVVAEPWAAPFAAADLAAALRLRLPGADVAVVPAASAADRSEGAFTVRWLDALRGLRVEGGSGDAVEFPLAERVDGSVERALAARRAALVIALFAQQGASLAEGPPGASSAPPGTPTGHRAGAGPPPTAPPATPPGSGRVERAGWEASAQLGPALAIEDDEISSTVALTVRARRWVSSSAGVELGAKLSGEYTASAEPQDVGLADRAFFAGAVYEAWLSPRVAIDLGAALQYTYPVVDIDGEGPVSGLDAPTSTRYSVRTSAGLVWTPREHVTLGLSAATSFSFREREYVDDAGREVLGLGTMILDLTAGAGVRW